MKKQKGPRRDAGRIFTGIVSTIFVAIGIMGIADGTAYAWHITIFFGLCVLVAIVEPWLRKPWLECEFKLVFTEDEIACEHWKREREAIRWEDVTRIWYVTTADGPHAPDEWLLFEGEHGGCSFPTEVKAMPRVWDELTKRFPGFDYGPIIRGGTTFAKHLCWVRPGLGELQSESVPA